MQSTHCAPPHLQFGRYLIGLLVHILLLARTYVTALWGKCLCMPVAAQACVSVYMYMYECAYKHAGVVCVSVMLGMCAH